MSFFRKGDLNRFVRSFAKYIQMNKKGLLTGVAIAGTFINTGMAVRTGWNVHDIYNKMIYDLSFIDPRDYMTRKSIINKACMDAIPYIFGTAATTLGTSGAMMYYNHITNQQIAALATGYMSYKTMYDVTDNKITEVFGDKGHSQIRQAIAQDETNKVAMKGSDAILVTGTGSFICVDPKTGRAFRTCGEALIAAKEKISEKITAREWASQNDLYIELGIGQVEDGHLVGFPASECFKDAFGKCIAPIDILTTDYNGEPAYELDYVLYPKPEYIANS